MSFVAFRKKSVSSTNSIAGKDTASSDKGATKSRETPADLSAWIRTTVMANQTEGLAPLPYPVP